MLRVEKNSFESMSNSIYRNLKIIDRYTLINRSKPKIIVHQGQVS